MHTHLKDVIFNYIERHNINTDNIVDIIKSLTYPIFFNELTTDFLGLPNFTYDDRRTSSEASLSYIDDAVTESLINNLTEVSVNNLFVVSALSNDIEYNYPEFKALVGELFDIRNSLKTEFKNSDDTNRDTIDTAQTLIKYYLNTIYGAIDNSLTVLSSNNNNGRQIIVERSKNIILSIVEFLIKQNHPIFCIDTDVIYTDKLSEIQKTELIKFIKTRFDDVLDSRYLNLNFESEDLSGYFISKKKFIIGKKLQSKGLREINVPNIIKYNKMYFGKEYPDIFPEYSF